MIFNLQSHTPFWLSLRVMAVMAVFLLPLYLEEGKLSLTIGVGCTGGRHRSVAIASALTEYLKAKGVSAVNVNRDIDK